MNVGAGVGGLSFMIQWIELSGGVGTGVAGEEMHARSSSYD